MRVMNKRVVWITAGVIGAVLVCLAIYMSCIKERPGFSDTTLQAEPNDVAAKPEPNEPAVQPEPNQVTTHVEPNEVTPKTASLKDTFKD